MPETEEINRILGKLEQEILNLRDSEAIKLIEPFVKSTKELVEKINSIDFPKRLDEISKKISDVDASISVVYASISDFQNSVNKKFEDSEKKHNFNRSLSITTIVLVIVVIVIMFIR